MGSEIIIDDFLNDFDSIRKHCDSVNYEGELNPVNGVFYPGVSLDIPQDVEDEIIAKIQEAVGGEIKVNAMFLRLSTSDMDAPHQAHTDASMGDFSLMLYLNRIEDCEGGTSYVMHKRTGMASHPINEKQVKTWEKDCNNHEAWQITSICPMLPNRAFVFNAASMHRAEPVGGFGDNAKNGRLVLTVFFNRA